MGRRAAVRLALPVVAAALLLFGGAWGVRALRLAPDAPAATAGAAVFPDAPVAEEERLLQALRAAPSGEAAAALALGEFYLQRGRPFSALWASSFAPGKGKAPEPRVALLRARAFSAALFLEPAIESWEAVLRGDPGHPEAVRELVELYLRTGRPEAALRRLEPAGSAGRLPAVERALLEGRAREAAGDRAGAERAYRRAAAGEGGPEAWHRLGLLLDGDGRGEEAREALERARALDRSEPRILVDLARVTEQRGGPEARAAAMTLYRQAVARRPFAPAYYHSTMLLRAEQRPELVAEGLARAIAADREFAPAHLALADLLQQQGRRADAHYHRGLYYSIRDLRAPSAREYERMAAADPKAVGGPLMASQAYYKMAQTARATDWAREARSRDPKSREARAQLAALLLASANREEAGRLCREWLEEEPDAVMPLWLLGRRAVADVQLSEGIALYERALEREPENVDILESLGHALLETRDESAGPRAVETFRRMALLAPLHANARYQLGVALMRQERLEEAQRQLLRGLDLDPHLGEAYNLLVQNARRLRQPGAVALFGARVREVEERLRVELRLWRRTWDRPEEAEGYVELARFLIATGDLSKAESQLEEALRLEPARAEAREQLALVRRLLAVQ